MSSPKFLSTIVCLGLLVTSIPAAPAADNPAAPGATRIARWKDDKQAAFELMFDDSIGSQLKNVVPELQKRHMAGTFYINPGKGEWRVYGPKWTEVFTLPGMVAADHTMTHKGVTDLANAEEEIGKCDEVVLSLQPGKVPRLVSFGQPGVGKGMWNITPDELKQLLPKYHLIDRPPFAGRGAMVAFKDSAAMLAHVDKALAGGTSECIVFHGVGGDYITTPLPIFLELLDGLETRREKLWITDHISAHKYAMERDSAEVRTLENGAATIRLSLADKADPQLYDAPLTLVTRVPAGWTRCQVTQGASKSIVPVADGLARFDALPGADPIVLQAATGAPAATPGH